MPLASRRSSLADPGGASSFSRVRMVDIGRVEVESADRRDPRPGEVVVRVTSCGLCGSDASMLTGRHPVIRPPLVPGHEIVGVGARAGAGAEAFLGRRVAVMPQIGCGACAACRRGHPRLCAEMRLIGGQLAGGAADEVLVPAASLVPVPDAVPEEVLPIIEPLAVAAHAVGRAPGIAGGEALVVGGGPIGLLVALAALAAGAASVTLVETAATRREVVAHFGVPVVDAIPDAQHDVVFDCVGGRELPAVLLGSVRAGGALVLVGVSAPELAFDGILLQRQERAILGSHMYTRADFEAALGLLAEGVLPTDEVSLSFLFDRRPLADAPDAFADLVERRSSALKILLIP